jgi:hypothetical protein
MIASYNSLALNNSKLFSSCFISYLLGIYISNYFLLVLGIN